MHRSRVHGVLIDVPREQAPAAARFWSATLGVPARADPAEPQFTSLRGGLPGLAAVVQAIDGEARYHLDIETDDVAAEVRRLVAAGATEVAQWLECHVLRAPGGHLLCVVPVQSDRDAFDATARTWP